MKIRNLLLLILLVFNFNISAQVAAPTIKVFDIFGNFYNSDDILAEGKHVFVDFFNNSCSSCQYLAPFVDSAYQELGCNCGDVFYFAINVNDYSTNESVFEFTQHFGLEMPAVSGEGGGSHVADIYNIPFSPYFTIVSPEGYIVWDTSIFITSQQEWLDTMANYGILPTVCSGTDILFYEAKTDVDTFIASIDAINKNIYLHIPQDVNVSELEIFMISSSKSEVFLDGNIQNKDSSIVDLSDSLLTYTVFAENDTVFSDWNVILQTLPVFVQNVDDFSMYFDYQNNELKFSDVNLVEQYFVFDIYGHQQFKVSPNVNNQNFNALPVGVYIIVAKLFNGEIINQKIILN